MPVLCRVVEGTADDAPECGKPAIVRVYPKMANGGAIPMCEAHYDPQLESNPYIEKVIRLDATA